MLNINPTNRNRPTKKLQWSQKSNVTEKNGPRGMRTLAIQLTGKQANQWASGPVDEQATKCTNKPYPFVKNIYYIVFVYSKHCIYTLHSAECILHDATLTLAQWTYRQPEGTLV